MTAEKHSELGTNARNCRWKLHKRLEEHLGKSFVMVTKQLLVVQKGWGEMQTIASVEGDQKKVLTNVKTRGVLEKIQKKINEANHEIENLVGTRIRIM